MRPIIAFTKDWSDVPTCTTHILRRLAIDRPVLWIESIGTRRPRAGSARDLRRIFQRLRQACRGPRHIENRLWVWSPLLIPRAASRPALAINRCLLNAVVRRWRKTVAKSSLTTNDYRLTTNPPDFWCFVPNAGGLVRAWGREPRFALRATQGREQGGTRTPSPTFIPPKTALPSLQSAVCSLRSAPSPSPSPSPPALSSTPYALSSLIYYCVDDWSRFENLDGEWLQQQENALLQRADHVFAASRFLEQKCRAVAGERVHYMPHGVDLTLFRKALDPATAIPAVFNNLPQPVIGFYGNISAWIDFELLAALARLRPDWSFVLIGPVYADVTALRALPNVHFPGRVEHALLPGCCKAFSAAVIPYDMRHPRMQSVNPVKARELLAAGVPVVSCNIPEMREFGSGVRIVGAAHAEAWVDALEQMLKQTDRQAISQTVSNDDWDARVREILVVSR